jgi:hypothetical protein
MSRTYIRSLNANYGVFCIFMPVGRCQFVSHCVSGSVGPAARSYLAVDVRYMPLHGANAYNELFSNFSRLVAPPAINRSTSSSRAVNSDFGSEIEMTSRRSSTACSFCAISARKSSIACIA